MGRSFREKIALAVFLVLVVLSLIGLGWYILAGHSWNVAASTIDDTVGEMEGYTAIIYPGTIETDGKSCESEGTVAHLSASQEDGERAVDLARLLFLDLNDPSQYEEGSILKRGDKRIGVVSAAGSTTQLDVSRCLQSFERAEVDFTIVIAPAKWKISRLDGIDIAICMDDEGIVAMGETEGGTFYVDAPCVGEAGVVLVSPSNVVSAKEVTEN